MADFYGKTYRYGFKVIGVCSAHGSKSYMIGRKVKDGFKPAGVFPLFRSIKKAQSALNNFARAKGLEEASE